MTRMITAVMLMLALGVATAAAQSGSGPGAATKERAAIGAPMNLNTATAERIVEYRQKGGGFKKIEELRVLGAFRIGPRGDSLWKSPEVSGETTLEVVRKRRRPNDRHAAIKLQRAPRVALRY